MVGLPNIVDDTRALGDGVPHVSIFFKGCMWYTKNDSWHPSQALLDAATDVEKVIVVVHIGQSVRSHNTINLFLGTSLHLRPDQ